MPIEALRDMTKSFYSLKIKTRYAETDRMGYIHHSVYPIYLEAARIEWLNSLGISYKRLEDSGILLPVYDMRLRFLVPLTFDECIEVRVSLRPVTGAKLIFDYEIYNEKGQKSTQAEVVLFFASRNGKPVRPPHEILVKLQSVTGS